MSYQQFITAARGRLASAARETCQVAGVGTVEFVDDGAGPPALVSHPLFGGFDTGLGVGRQFLGPDHRIVAPSRFGYLGSTMPHTATPADQADAFTAVLDELELDRVVVLGYSAGGPSVIQLALRHPERVSALVLVASALPGKAGNPPRLVARALFGSDVTFWLLGRMGPSVTARILGMDRQFRPVGSQRQVIEDTWASLFPVAPRKRGVLHDLYVSNPDVQTYPLEKITVPTLVLSAHDDAMSAYDNAESAVPRISSARLVSFADGGHLLLDHDDAIRRSVADFLQMAPSPRSARAGGLPPVAGKSSRSPTP
ncbi:alpha/beta fold hydrolase [Puerhibacterium sp. TATVAM-FAB25]|uniref:alpha/beta fold hydrolase n=1 Tax=Puerhibacterium sp. TATVAM-FAB25 TaxID=3093699 RepID=UPI00397DA5C3